MSARMLYMMQQTIRCPKCGKTPRYAMQSLKRFARDAEGKAILDNGEPVMEIAYRCRGCLEVFYSSEASRKQPVPRVLQEVLDKVLNNRKDEEDKHEGV